jgi:hypothetical protein
VYTLARDVCEATFITPAHRHRLKLFCTDATASQLPRKTVIVADAIGGRGCRLDVSSDESLLASEALEEIEGLQVHYSGEVSDAPVHLCESTHPT